MSGPERLRRDDEFTPRQRQRCRPRHPHEGGNAEHAENEGEVGDRLPEIGGHRQRQDQGWKRQQHVHAADHDRLEPAAEIAREHAERAADDEADHRRAQPDRERNPRAIDEPWSSSRPARRCRASAPWKTAPAAPACPCRSGSAAAARARGSRPRHENHPADRHPEQQSQSAPRFAGSAATPSSIVSSSVAMTNPGIEHGVEHVDDEVHDHEAGGDQQHHALQDDESRV